MPINILHYKKCLAGHCGQRQQFSIVYYVITLLLFKKEFKKSPFLKNKTSHLFLFEFWFFTPKVAHLSGYIPSAIQQTSQASLLDEVVRIQLIFSDIEVLHVVFGLSAEGIVFEKVNSSEAVLGYI